MRVNQPVTQRENDSMDDHEFICSKTDREGIITYANTVFCRVAGYTEAELLGQAHNIVRHPDMPCVAYAWVWDRLQRGRDWNGIVKNRCKNGDHYWVDANVSPQIGSDGGVIGYLSTRRKPTRAQIDAAEALYAELRQAEGDLERRGAMTAGEVMRMYRESPLYGPR